MSSESEKLSFVLTLASSGTGRDDQDFQRAQILLESFECFFNLEHHDRFIIVCPEKDRQRAAKLVSPWEKAINFRVLDENAVCPELGNDPETTDKWPKPNKGWYRQQIIKLAAFEHVRTPFYMTLDSDVLFVRDFDVHTLIRNGKAALNVQTESDYRNLYREETASSEIQVRDTRYRRAEKVIDCNRKAQYANHWYGETPVLMSRHIVSALVQHLQDISGKPWRRYLLDSLPWTEYPLYFIFAEEQGLLERFYIPGNADSLLCLSKSLWRPAEEYSVARDLSTWDTDSIFGTEDAGVAVVVQSYLGYPVTGVLNKIRPYISRLKHPPAPPVSVVVPVHNVEKYVVQCLDSLLEQELPGIEIIIVDDGSTDGTLEIAEEYAQVHENIHLLSQHNQGLSAARNAGMDAASGDYMGFVDGDDWVHPRMFFSMHERARESNADLVICNGQRYNDETGDYEPIQDFPIWAALHDSNESLEFSPRIEPDLFMLDTSACKRLYKRDFLESLAFRFPPGKIFEDVSTHYRLLLNTDTVALIDEAFYNYRTHRPGRITARNDESLFQVFDIMEQVIEDLYEHEAETVIWANFVWFQNWVLRWLRQQIDPRYSSDFDRHCHEISQKFKPGALEHFNKKFKDNAGAIEFVNLQVGNLLRADDETNESLVTGPAAMDTLHLGNDPEGIFNPDPHTFMPDIWGWICLGYNVRSVLDIGCGIGTNLSWFHEYGFDVIGVEGHPNAIVESLLPDKVVQHDFSKGPWAPENEYDLCICTEFAEHVEAEFEENWMVAVDKCKYVLLAAAPPGQGGYHHVNEQTDEYWLERFESHGFIQNREVTSQLRATCSRKPAPWGRNTIMFFMREEPGDLTGNVIGPVAGQTADHHPLGGQDIRELIDQNRELKQRVNDLYASLSWKITAPCRWLLELFKKSPEALSNHQDSDK
jgi:glycosyltransferase involved in cell wall biosynthesis